MDQEDEEIANDTPPLPLELVTEILTRVPPKPVCQFKCVSKEWLDLINNPSFIKRHVTHSVRAKSSGTLIIHHFNTLYTLDFHDPNFRATELYYPENITLPQLPRLHLIGSCNGLLCVEFSNQIALYNPITRAYKIIPQYNTIEDFQGVYEKPVFAYDSISNDYKILRFEREKLSRVLDLESLFPEHHPKRILLYSLSTNSWEIIECPHWSKASIQFPGIVANNSIYWMDSNNVNIKCFDLYSRRFYEMPLPEKISPGYSPKLAVLGGKLYIVTSYFDIWKFEDDSWEQERKWTRVFRCPSSQWNVIYELGEGLHNWGTTGFSLACSENGSKILVARVCGPLNFICCDLESQETTIIEEVPGLSSKWRNYSAILPWVGCLVPLSD